MSTSEMITPVFTYDPWERYVMTMEEIDERKKRITAAFNSSQVPYAIIGGMAVAEWVASKDPDGVRTTKDVDMLLDRSDWTRQSPLPARWDSTITSPTESRCSWSGKILLPNGACISFGLEKLFVREIRCRLRRYRGALCFHRDRESSAWKI